MTDCHPQTPSDPASEGSSLSERRLLVSMTSYPQRIGCVPAVLETLLRQTRPADGILLYLAGEQFPGREADLPPALCAFAEAGQVRIRWTEDDLKPHKKYFYAFREFPDSLIVTVDDDALYAPTLLEELWKTHCAHPRAVAAGRTHLITLDDSGAPRPYARWIHRVQGMEEGPSMQLFAVGVGGALYDPGWFPPELFREDILRETCLMGDDLWLKVMEAAAGIPVVRCGVPETLRTIPGSQETALYQENLHENRNDEMLARIRERLSALWGQDPLLTALQNPAWPRVTGEDLLTWLNGDRRRLITSVNQEMARANARVTKEVTARVTKEVTKEVTQRVTEKVTEKVTEQVTARQEHKAEARLAKQKEYYAQEKAKLQEEIARLQGDLEEVRSSTAYRLGGALTAPLRKLRPGGSDKA